MVPCPALHAHTPLHMPPKTPESVLDPSPPPPHREGLASLPFPVCLHLVKFNCGTKVTGRWKTPCSIAHYRTSAKVTFFKKKNVCTMFSSKCSMLPPNNNKQKLIKMGTLQYSSPSTLYLFISGKKKKGNIFHLRLRLSNYQATCNILGYNSISLVVCTVTGKACL